MWDQGGLKLMQTSSRIYPVYFLYGVEDYLIEEEIKKLTEQTFSPHGKGLNLHLFSGTEHGSGEIIQAAQTLPMFSPYRFVLVNEVDQMSEEEIERLLRYIQRPSPTTCFVLRGQGAGLWKRHQAKIEKVGRVIEYPRLKGKALVSWVKKRMEEKGKTLTEDAANYLVEVTGDHLQNLDNALEKVFLSLGETRAIRLSDIEGIISDIKANTIFELTEAIGQQNLEKAFGILRKVLGTKIIAFKKEEAPKVDDPSPLLLSMMARQYRLIWRVKEMVTHQKDPEEVAKSLRMSLWNVKKLVDQAKNFSEPSLKEGILKCQKTDLALKKGRGPKDLLLEKLVIDLCRPIPTSPCLPPAGGKPKGGEGCGDLIPPY
ncbi:MAG: DNA polymerase III subunit delta [Deltaproteobacteria bacterium RBG_16_47_11]|nr:MAG: DNA polymerase III subunit delta [Deltaproteobacteria bacterium RBG_16_47_11]